MGPAYAFRMPPLTPSRAILGGGLTVAVLDMAMALGFWGAKGVAPTRILQSIAAGLLGRDAALAGGASSALLGATLHLLIATTMVATYCVASRRLRVLVERPLVCGLLYGVVSWAAMKFVVLPLSAAPPGSPNLVWQAAHFSSHLFLVGVPSALFARAIRWS